MADKSSRKDTHYNKPEKPPFKGSGDRPQRGGDDAKPYRKREEGDRPFKPRAEGDRPFRPRTEGDKPYRKREEGDKPFRRNSGEDKPFRRSSGDDKPAYRKRDEGDRPFKPRAEGDKPYRKREEGDRPFRKTEGGDRPYSGRPRSGGDDKKPFRKREEGDRPFKPRAEGDRPFRKREEGDRPFKPRAEGDRPFRKREEGDRPFKPRAEGDKPYRKREEGGDRPFRRSGGDDKPAFRKRDEGGERGGDRRPHRGSGASERKASRGEGRPAGGFHSESPTGKKRVFRKGEDDRKERASKEYSKRTKFDREDLWADDEQEEQSIHGKWDEAEKAGPMTLNKYLAHSGVSSRRDAATMVKDGQVQVNGEVVKEPGYRVKETDVVLLNGKPMTPQRKHVYILLNKPKDFITTTEDDKGRRTVMDLVATADVDRLYPVGRLDRNTTGVLLMTNDGDLMQKLSHPSYEVKKIYQVTTDKPVTKADFDKILEGVELEDGLAKVDRLSYLETKSEIGLEIHSGRNRIVRRIFESMGYDVVKLDRVMYAGLTKKNVSRGKWRYLNEKEVTFLKHFKS